MKCFSLLLKKGFTLVEMLVTMTVLLVLGLIVSQLIQAVSQTTSLTQSSADAASQARLAFDRIALDLSFLVKRPDVDFYAKDLQTSLANANYSSDDPNTLLLFLSSVTSPSSSVSVANNRGISLVAYQVNLHPDNEGKRCLVRSGITIRRNLGTSQGFMGIKSNGLPVQFHSSDAGMLASLLPTAPTANQSNDYDVLAHGVIHMAIGFQLFPDEKSVVLKDGTMITRAQGQVVYSPPVRGFMTNPSQDYIDVDRIASLVVSVVAVDVETLKLLNNSHLVSLASVFEGPLPQDNLPLKVWGPISDALVTNASLSTIPLSARQSIRLFQRFFPVTLYQSNSL
ncbi:MAG: type II secretion system protein [Verrucomicrobiota bacterium]